MELFYSANDLEYKEIERPQMIVENLLPVGLTVLAGSPKLGKSWLVLELACAVASGEDFLNHPTSQGDALYLDLEGSQYRLKERLQQLDRGFPEYLRIAHEAPALGNGLIEVLEYWWSYTSFPRLVVIDTIVKVRGKGKQGLNAYESDSEMYSPLQRFAIEKNISIVVVTHLRKSNSYFGNSDDWLERITGSMGLSGVSDNIWGLFRQRGSETAYLRTSSRDCDAGDFVLQFDGGKWLFVSDDVNSFEFSHLPIVQFLETIVFWQGLAAELYEKYVAYCKENALPHGLSGSQPIVSFGKHIRKIIPSLWRIRKSIAIEKRREGQFYMISTL